MKEEKPEEVDRNQILPELRFIKNTPAFGYLRKHPKASLFL